jgi:hypothetical protein
VKTEKKLKTIVKTAKAKVTAKADKVKTIERTARKFRVEKEKLVVSISILTFTIFITSQIFISIFNPFVSDHLFQTFNIGDIRDCKVPYSSRQINSAQAEATVNVLADPDSILLFKVPETQPDPHSRSLSGNLLVPKHLPSGQVRKSENDLYNDSSIFNYLDSSRQIY